MLASCMSALAPLASALLVRGTGDSEGTGQVGGQWHRASEVLRGWLVLRLTGTGRLSRACGGLRAKVGVLRMGRVMKRLPVPWNRNFPVADSHHDALVVPRGA